MKRHLLALAALPILGSPIAAQDAPSPNAIVAQAPAGEWVAIAPEDLLVMDLAPDRDPGVRAGAGGAARRVVVQLIPPPFSQGWVDNIRTLARAHWWDGTSVNRVQDNYVAQWGDAAEAKPLPAGLTVVPESRYTVPWAVAQLLPPVEGVSFDARAMPDPYARQASFKDGWPVADDGLTAWPVHCYATVGVGRGLSPDTGTGAELYAVIGHAPRHLDRNIAVVGRVVEGIEHLSSLPRGKGDLGFYDDPAERVPIASVRLASELPDGDRPRFETLDTRSATFARYADARANRRDPFFIVPAGGADVCNIPVPVRRVGAGE